MSGLQLLIVDDDKDLAASLAEYLELDGNHVDTACSGEAGLAATGKKKYDAILMDVVLPGINGFACMAAVKRTNPSLPVLLMTGFSADHLIQEIEDYGHAEIMTKPIKMSTLNQRLNELCGRES